MEAAPPHIFPATAEARENGDRDESMGESQKKPSHFCECYETTCMLISNKVRTMNFRKIAFLSKISNLHFSKKKLSTWK